MKRELVVSWVFNVILAFTCGYFFFYWHTQSLSTRIKKTRSRTIKSSPRLSVKKYRVAILLPAQHKALEKIKKGFEEALIKKYKLNTFFTTYNSNGDQSLMRAQVEEIVSKKYDLVFCIGARASQLTQEIFTKRQSTIPIVFGAVADPVRVGLVQKDASQRKVLVSGSTTTTDYFSQIEFLLLLKPEVKKVLLIYDPSQSSGLTVDADLVVKNFENRDISVKKLEVSNLRDIQQKTPLLLADDVDVVMILKDNTVVSAVDMLIKMCEKYNKTLYVSDLDSVYKGAALGFGVHEKSFGIEAAACAYEVLHNKVALERIFIREVKNFKFLVNKTKLEKQNVKLSKNLKRLLDVIEIVGEK